MDNWLFLSGVLYNLRRKKTLKLFHSISSQCLLIHFEWLFREDWESRGHCRFDDRPRIGAEDQKVAKNTLLGA